MNKEDVQRQMSAFRSAKDVSLEARLWGRSHQRLQLSCEAATEENAKRRSFMPRTQVAGKANLPGLSRPVCPFL